MVGCVTPKATFSPRISDQPTQSQVSALQSAFPPLTKEEQASAWSQEYRIGVTFAREMDLYRAITSFKRTLVLLPKDAQDRRQQTQYALILSYFLGQKYEQAILSFEESDLTDASPDFPAFRELLIILDEAYYKVGEPDNASQVLNLLKQGDPEAAKALDLSQALRSGEIEKARAVANPSGSVERVLHGYEKGTKSQSKARRLNALLPGLGYAYAGQRSAAMTSFIINTLFVAATYQLFDHGHEALGAIVGSLEMGWYVGGINGAGLAAVEYNERYYEPRVARLLQKERLFPMMMFHYAF